MRVSHLLSVAGIQTLEVWEQAADKILKYIKAENYSLVVTDQHLSRFREITPSRFDVIPESSVVGEIGTYLYQKLPEENKWRYGWYLQQFIKIEFFRRFGIGERFLIWDADIVPLRPIDFFDSQGGPIFFYWG